MAHIDIQDGKIRIDSEYRERELVKLVPGTTWDKDEKVWRAPLSWGSCIALRGVFGADMTVGESLSNWSWEMFNNRVEPAHQMRETLEAPELMTTEPNLYPFQRSGVRFLEIAKHALIADEMGSGKTVQLIRTVARNESKPVLVVAPNSMKLTWKKEFETWAPDYRVEVVNGTAAQRRKQIKQVAEGNADVLVINWESLRLHTKMEAFGNGALSDKEKEPKELNAIDWDTVIADEAHKAKEPKAKQTRALWGVSRNARYRFAATGTPVANHPGELWSIMNFVAPDDFPRKSKFVDRYCQVSWNAFGGMEILGVKPQTKDEFHQIVDSRMIRRIKEVVLPYLPPKVFTTRYVTMDPKQRKAYNQMAETMLAQLDNGIIDATNPLAQMTRLSQFACSYAEMTEDGNVQLQAPSNKIDALMEIMEETEGQQVVVFAESRQLIELAEAQFEKAKISFGSLHGNVPVPVRQQNIEDFQAGKLRAMLVTLGAGGEGITLTAASVAVFLQRSWSMVKNKQAEDRLHRPGQEAQSVEIIDIMSQNTIEEYRALRLLDKEDRLQEVVRDDELRAILTYRGE
jgi:SNF2 family DNA or RNA helicase